VDWKLLTEYCPMQYEKTTDNGNYAYVRYRWGILSFYVAKSENDPFDEKILLKTWEVGNEFDGSMEKEESDQWLKYFDYLIKKLNL